MNKFNSKILLFGEYAIIKGGHGLAVPFKEFSGELKIGGERNPTFDKLYDYIADSPLLSKNLNLELFKSDLDQGVAFDSNIPQGYGIGSSGALCASIYARYAKDFSRKLNYSEEELKVLQDYMALMESFYHGTSSGLDCLISLVNEPVFIAGRKNVSTIENPALDSFGHFYLKDSKLSRKTSPLVHQFLMDMESSANFKNSFEDFVDHNNKIIDDLVHENIERFQEGFKSLSFLQLELFHKMIPEVIRNFWTKGLQSDAYFTKLCGAGGGGFFLVYSKQTISDDSLVSLNGKF